MFMDEEMLAALMGGGGSFRGGGRGGSRRRIPDTHRTIKVTLKQIFHGDAVEFSHTRQIVCLKCRGKGTNKPNAQTRCPQCRGQGVELRTVAVGPNMIQQMQAECSVCNGEGSKIQEKDKCTSCYGARVVEQQVPLNIPIQKGAPSGLEMPFENQGDQHPDLPNQSGHLIIELEEEPHAVFVREDANLIMTKKISLAQALCGCRFLIPHLSGQNLLIDTFGQIIKVGDSRTILGEGLPTWQSSKKRGHLIIKFDVQFPSTSLSSDAVTLLKKSLPAPIPEEDNFDRNEAEECFVEAHSLDRLKEEIAKDDDEGEAAYAEMGGDGHSVQCGMQ